MGNFTDPMHVDAMPHRLSRRGRRFRLGMGWTLETIANRMGCSVRTLIRLEGDPEAVRAAKFATILEWSRALGLSFAEFQTGELPRISSNAAARCRSPRAGRV